MSQQQESGWTTSSSRRSQGRGRSQPARRTGQDSTPDSWRQGPARSSTGRGQGSSRGPPRGRGGFSQKPSLPQVAKKVLQAAHHRATKKGEPYILADVIRLITRDLSSSYTTAAQIERHASEVEALQDRLSAGTIKAHLFAREKEKLDDKKEKFITDDKILAEVFTRSISMQIWPFCEELWAIIAEQMQKTSLKRSGRANYNPLHLVAWPSAKITTTVPEMLAFANKLRTLSHEVHSESGTKTVTFAQNMDPFAQNAKGEAAFAAIMNNPAFTDAQQFEFSTALLTLTEDQVIGMFTSIINRITDSSYIQHHLCAELMIAMMHAPTACAKSLVGGLTEPSVNGVTYNTRTQFIITCITSIVKNGLRTLDIAISTRDAVVKRAQEVVSSHQENIAKIEADIASFDSLKDNPKKLGYLNHIKKEEVTKLKAAESALRGNPKKSQPSTPDNQIQNFMILKQILSKKTPENAQRFENLADFMSAFIIALDNMQQQAVADLPALYTAMKASDSTDAQDKFTAAAHRLSNAAHISGALVSLATPIDYVAKVTSCFSVPSVPDIDAMRILQFLCQSRTTNIDTWKALLSHDGILVEKNGKKTVRVQFQVYIENILTDVFAELDATEKLNRKLTPKLQQLKSDRDAIMAVYNKCRSGTFSTTPAPAPVAQTEPTKPSIDFDSRLSSIFGLRKKITTFTKDDLIDLCDSLSGLITKSGSSFAEHVDSLLYSYACPNEAFRKHVIQAFQQLVSFEGKSYVNTQELCQAIASLDMQELRVDIPSIDMYVSEFFAAFDFAPPAPTPRAPSPVQTTTKPLAVKQEVSAEPLEDWELELEEDAAEPSKPSTVYDSWEDAVESSPPSSPTNVPDSWEDEDW
jgi:hypothetical protein